MLEQMKALAREKNMCVLATAGGGKPHCSLMAYITDADCREIYMFTPQETRKFRNLMDNNRVSLLIDNRADAARQHIRALTVYGQCEAVNEPEKRRRILARFVGIHPHLKNFVQQNGIALLCINVSAFLLLDGPSESHFIELST